MKQFDICASRCEAMNSLMLNLIASMGEIDADEVFYLVLSGVNTACQFFDFWNEYYLHTLEWKRLGMFWADERCVWPLSEKSNLWTGGSPPTALCNLGLRCRRTCCLAFPL